jgi:multiple sugar transport system permease protein
MATLSTPARTGAVRQVEGKQPGRSVVGALVFYTLLILCALFFLLPLVWMTVTAFKPFTEWLTPNWIPREPTLENFTSVFRDPSLPVSRWFLNSLFIAVVFTSLILIVDSLAAYAYARMEFPGKNLLFGLLLATLVMPGITFLIPNYLTIARVGWLGTYQGVIAPGLSGVFGVFFLRQFFQGIPREMEEAAYIDGASIWRTFFSVVLPLSGGALATLGIITFLESWNSFLWPLLIVGSDRMLQTLPVGLATLQGQYTFDYGKLMAGALVVTVPVLLLYLAAQRYIVESISTTGIKG